MLARPTMAIVAASFIASPIAHADLTGTTFDATLVQNHPSWPYAVPFTHTYGSTSTVWDPLFPQFPIHLTTPGGVAGTDHSIVIDYGDNQYADFSGTTGELHVTGLAETIDTTSLVLLDENGQSIGTITGGGSAFSATWNVDEVLAAGSGTLVRLGWSSGNSPQSDPIEWPRFEDETITRLIADPSISTADTQEKDYAWADVDKDGDIDLIVVRKQPWNTEGRFRNVLLMNEGIVDGHAVNGVLVDRTAKYASAADDGGQGFLDLTNDRDAHLVDLDGDTWVDLVTSTTYGSGLPKTISHPRIYMNLGEVDGVWQGFRYEQARTPTMPITPHFCGVGVGDINNDNAPDLYFVDYNNDLEDRLWINDGTGFFTDETLARLTFEMRESDFGVHAVIADLNNDGAADIVKDRGSTASTPPLRVSVTWNDPDAPGVFETFEVVHNGFPYHIAVGDLNSDGLLDIVIDDDGLDRYLLNQGNGPDGQADFINLQFPPASDSFGGNIVIHDINQDGFDDVVIADVDVDCCGCGRHMHIWRNLGDTPNVSFVEETGGIPDSARTGTHDVAIVDLNGDQWDDMVIGTCTGMSIWIAQPELRFSYPDGLPGQSIPPDEALVIQVQVDELVGASVVSSSMMVHVSINDGPFTPTPATHLGDDLFEVTIPAIACGDAVRFYVSAEDVSGAVFVDPPDAPNTTYATTAAVDSVIVLNDDFEGDGTDWTVTSESLTAGAWEVAEPIGTIQGTDPAAPDDDASPGPGGHAFITENGPPGGSAGLADVDGGPTDVMSPRIDLAGADGIVRYDRWFFSATGETDVMTVWVSNDDGSSWTEVVDEATSGTGGTWEPRSFRVGTWITPTDEVRVRFRTADQPNNSITEAGLDTVSITRLTCVVSCPGDVASPADGQVNVTDLLAMLSAWGSSDPQFDIAPEGGDGIVGIQDLLLLLSAWGACGP